MAPGYRKLFMRIRRVNALAAESHRQYEEADRLGQEGDFEQASEAWQLARLLGQDVGAETKKIPRQYSHRLRLPEGWQHPPSRYPDWWICNDG